MIEWLSEHPWIVEGLVTMVTAAMIGTIVYFWIEHFKGDN